MRIVIGCQEICGWIGLLSSEFEKAGHQVISISSKSKYYQETKYTLDKSTFEKDYFQLRLKKKYLVSLFYTFYSISKMLGKKIFKKDLNNRVRLHANNYLYRNTDVYIHIWEGLEANDADLLKFKNNGTKIISWFVGDDIRYYPAALKEFNIDNNYFIEYSKKDIYTRMLKLRMHEKYSDVIFSVPDQSSLALRPYFHLQIPINLSMYIYKKTENVVPVILHIPSAPLLKGTAIFENALKDLKDEGLEFEFKSVSNITNKEVRKLLSDADILLDELYMHGPGMIGIEAMASGCCVVVKYLESSPKCFQPPVVSVNVENVKEKVRELIINHKLRNDLIDKGLIFVRNHNQVRNVCNLILDKLTCKTYDYYPSYFRNKYNAEDGLSVFKINQLTKFVQECDWYKDYVVSGSRDQLVF